MGLKAGGGELVPVAAAIGNAIFDAAKIRMFELPISPEKVLKAIQEKERKTKGL